MTDHNSHTNSHTTPPDPSPPNPNASHLSPESLGVAGRMAQDFIHSPLSVIFYLALLAMGAISLILTPRQEDPQISVPMVDIFVQYPGASAEQTAKLAIEPLQRIMREITGVKHVYAGVEREQGVVTVQFEVGEDMENSVFKVHDKLQSNKDKIPPGVHPPLVKPKGIDDVPVVTLTLWSEDVDDSSLRTLALDVMQSLQGVKNTGQSFIVGGRAEVVKIDVMPERLSGFEISLGQVAQTIQTANSEMTVGFVEGNNTHYSISTGSFLTNAKAIENLVVGTHQGTPIYVRDIAKVTQGPEETQNIVNYFSGPAYAHLHKSHTDTSAAKTDFADINGAPAVTVAISKKYGSNGVKVAQDILAHVEILKGRLIPDNVQVEVTRNYGKTANDKVSELIYKLFIATGAVTLLVWLFLGWRAAIVVGAVIPVVILITVFSAWILGYTIDRVSLFALIFSIGILVDDAIVVIENIYRRWLLEDNLGTETAVDAVREVGNPTILATFTVVAALLPMGFVSGMMGPYMEPIPALGSIAMIFSLFAAFVFTPWLAMRLRPSLKTLRKQEEKEHKQNERWERFYRSVLIPLIDNKLKGFLFLGALVVAFILACMMFTVQWVEVKMMPLDNKPEFNVFINMPEGTPLPETANLTFQLTEKIREIPEVTAAQTYVGTSQPFDFNGMVRHYYLRQSPWQADIRVQLTEKKKRDRSSHEIANSARRMLKQLLAELESPARITIVEMPPGPPVLQSVVAEVYGPDNETRRQVAKDLTEIFEQAQIIDDVDNYLTEPYERWHFEVDTEKAVLRGISVDTINQNLAMALGEFQLGDIKRGTALEPTYIVMQVPLATRSQLSRLYDLPIPTASGGSMPLAELGRFVKRSQDQTIFYKDLRRVEFVVGDSVGIPKQIDAATDRYEYSLSAPIYGMLEVHDLLQNYTAPDGVKLESVMLEHPFFSPPRTDHQSAFEWTGEWTVTYETFRDMGAAFMVALVLIYMLVVWQFGNFLVPLVIMAPIPLTLLGIIPGHALKDASFTATSMIGWIALAGIIVRNSILLVDYSIHEVHKGTDLKDAVILACKTRTRPIIITALALIAGSSVILNDPIFEGMAISLMAGVLVSTILTLVVIPLGCMSIGTKMLCQANMSDEGQRLLTQKQEEDAAWHQREHAELTEKADVAVADKPPLWLRIWQGTVSVITTIFYIIRAIVLLIWMGIVALWQKFTQDEGDTDTKPRSNGTPPPSSPPPTQPPSPTGGQAQTPPASTQTSTEAQAIQSVTTSTTAETEQAVPSKPEPESATPAHSNAPVQRESALPLNRRASSPPSKTRGTACDIH